MTSRVRPLTLDEHRKVIAYFHNADDALLLTMGIDRSKLNPPEKWFEFMTAEFRKPLRRKSLFYLGWEHNGTLVGHSNVNKMKFEEVANIHLHLWNVEFRQKGLGLWFFKSSVNYFLQHFELKRILCEPHADNPAPNRLLRKLGLIPTKTYKTTPGVACFEQEVTRYEITKLFPIEEVG